MRALLMVLVVIQTASPLYHSTSTRGSLRKRRHSKPELDEKQRAHEREMQVLKAEKSQIEERASRAEADLAELKAKFERRSETETL